MNIISKILFGSKLYGTSIPESDTDHRSIYLPTLQDCALLKARGAWEDKSDKDDVSYFSLQHFLNMACDGQSIAIELLAAPQSAVVEDSALWRELHNNRKRFYTKSMTSFLGYAKSQSSKYSSRIDRLNETEGVLRVLVQYAGYAGIKLANVWQHLPESTNAVKTTNERNNNADKRVYQICGRELQATVSVAHAIEVVQKINDSYGERVKKAKNNEIEYKSMAHAFRATLQCREIVTTGDLSFPLQDAEYLKNMRLGKINFLENELDKKLDNLIQETQDLMDKSNLPEKADRKWADQFILKSYNL